jgi:hypothetical protein
MSYVRSLLSLALVVSGVASLNACAATADADAVEADSQELIECSAAGTWAIKISTPVKWNASFVVQAGTGTVTNYIRSVRTQNGLQVTDKAKLCGVETPDYQATATFGSEKYGIRFAPTAWDAPSMPTFALNATLSSKEVGATFNAGTAAALVGATLANPTTDAWPASFATTVDADGDGKPGLSADAATGPGISLPPLNPGRTVRANRVYAAFRQVINGVTGTVKSCTRSEGTGDIAVIGTKAAIDQRVLGCRREDGTECAASEFKLLDSAAPVYVPTGKAVLTLVKVADTATCADVRTTNFN